MPRPIASGNPLRGIAMKTLSVTIFVIMFALIKAAGQVPAGQIVFFRSFFAILPIVIVLTLQHELRGALHTSNPLGHIMRGVVGITAMSLSFFAVTRLPLPEAVTLGYAQPLLVVVFSALFLQEVIRLYRWGAVVVGLIGVVIISWPSLTLFAPGGGMGGDEALGVAAALSGAALAAVAMLLVRRLVHTERTSTIVLWFSLTASLLALATAPFGWAALSAWQVFLLVTAGICGGFGQILMTEAYRYAEASTVAPFEYTSMIFSIAIGYFIFGDLPTLYTLVGGLIVIAAGIFIIWRERQLGMQRARARKATSPQ